VIEIFAKFVRHKIEHYIFNHVPVSTLCVKNPKLIVVNAIAVQFVVCPKSYFEQEFRDECMVESLAQELHLNPFLFIQKLKDDLDRLTLPQHLLI
jgi:hypothetical protein